MQVHTVVVRPLAAAFLALALAVTLLVAGPAVSPAGAFPGQAQVDAAREAVRNQASTVAELDAAIEQLEKAYEQAERAARVALEEHARAQEESIAAQRELFAANERARQADASLKRARGILAEAASASQRDRESFGTLEAVLSSEGFDDVLARVELIQRASDSADRSVQEVHAAELVAAIMREHAEAAAVEAAEAEQRARLALERAQVALEEAAEALKEVELLREEALERLAELRRTSTQLERERQAGLEQQRRERERRAWEQRQQEQAAANNNTGGSSGGSDAPPPATTPPPGTTPPPATTPPPPPAPEPSGSWVSTAAQGQAAANNAVGLIGTPYETMNCSQLTGAAWTAAGVSLSGASRTQYTRVAHVAYGSIRVGDLVFWGTGQRANDIYHVAIYIGNGKIVEARYPGLSAHSRSMYNWAVNDMMPFVGRP